MMAQVNPPDNGRGPATFRRWFPDDITGDLVPEGQVTRDLDGRLRMISDVDAPDVSHLRDLWVPPEDRTDSEEPLE